MWDFNGPHGSRASGAQPILEEVGKVYYEFRAELMIRNDEGLTKTYNRFHAPDERHPDILKLRELHAAMDRAVLDAYGWTDIPTDREFILDYEDDEDEEDSTRGKKKKKPYRYRWPESIHNVVLAGYSTSTRRVIRKRSWRVYSTRRRRPKR